MYQTIDIEMALELLGRSEKLYKTLISGFYIRYKEVDQQIEALLKDGDAEGARRLAHSLKGLSGNLGSAGLKEKALNLECAIRDGQSDRGDRLKEFSHYLGLVVTDVEMILKTRYKLNGGTVVKKPEIGPSWQSVLLKLAKALERCRYEDVKAAFDSLAMVDVPERHLEEITEVSELVDVFNYDEANSLIRKMITNG